uniref:Uncharacterized protein n=1 Tax=Anguilla anguilla TaxID=7936 RepID=A0A0E9P9W6_ANGAN
MMCNWLTYAYSLFCTQSHTSEMISFFSYQISLQYNLFSVHLLSLKANLVQIFFSLTVWCIETRSTYHSLSHPEVAWYIAGYSIEAEPVTCKILFLDAVAVGDPGILHTHKKRKAQQSSG